MSLNIAAVVLTPQTLSNTVALIGLTRQSYKLFYSLSFSIFLTMPVSNSSQPVLNIPSPTLLSPAMIRNRARRGSLVKVEAVEANSVEDELDQSVFPDMNSEWVNRKGAVHCPIELGCSFP